VVPDKAANKITNIVNFASHSNQDREKVIKQIVDQQIKMNRSVIVIDELLNF
jgi:3-hydroxy-3-methylglutaryl CoA synthase